MKNSLQKIFSPVLNLFESGDELYAYKPSHRAILLAVGGLFSLLATGVFAVGLRGEGFGFLIPGLVFGSAALVSLIVGGLGSERAVAKLWGSRHGS
ncbi:MAG: hypothetical protein ACJAUP_002471 [Cellvibrionaceae bacterium]|jgi:hypothetical protein